MVKKRYYRNSGLGLAWDLVSVLGHSIYNYYPHLYQVIHIQAWISTKVITIEKTLAGLLFNYEPQVQKRQQVTDQQPYISAFVAYLSIPSSS